MNAISPLPPQAIHELVGEHARKLSARLQAHRLQLFPPTAKKTLRKFSSGEAAKLVGTDDSHLRRLSIEGKGADRRDGHERPTRLLDRGHSGFARLSRRQQSTLRPFA